MWKKQGVQGSFPLFLIIVLLRSWLLGIATNTASVVIKQSCFLSRIAGFLPTITIYQVAYFHKAREERTEQGRGGCTIMANTIDGITLEQHVGYTNLRRFLNCILMLITLKLRISLYYFTITKQHVVLHIYFTITVQ